MDKRPARLILAALIVSGAPVFFFVLPLVEPGGIVRAEKLAVATPIRGQPQRFLPLLAAEEKGFWKEQGLDVEWLSFRSGVELDQGILAGAVHVVLNPSAAIIIHGARGIPTIITADIGAFQPWYLWVRTDSAVKEAPDLKGRKIGVLRLGDLAHAYARVIVKKQGLETQVKYAAVGGIMESLAALRAGVVDALVLTRFTMARLEYEGIARKVVALADYLPKDWDPLTISVTKELREKKPEAVKKSVKALLRAVDFINRERGWSIDRIKKEMRLLDKPASEVYDMLGFSADGSIHTGRLEKIRDFMVEYGLVPKGKVPPLESLYSDKFLPAQ